MPKFRFDRLIEVKEKLIERKQRQLEDAIARRAEIVKLIELIELEITEKYSIITSKQLKGNEFSGITEYIECLDKKKDGLIIERERFTHDVNTLRSVLYELARDLRMLESLKDKAQRITQKAENRKEQKNLDQMALRIEERKI